MNRRDFLRLSGLLPFSLASQHLVKTLAEAGSASRQDQNVIVLVFDAFSAINISLYGYGRETTPNINRLAKRAIVYHNHYAGSNFTTPGTASLLTGTLPWTHRAFQAKHMVVAPYASKNLFGAFPDYYRIAYTHNGWANILLEQAQDELSELVPWKSLFLGSYDSFVTRLFGRDADISSVSWTRNVNLKDQGYSFSLLLSHAYQSLQEHIDPALHKLFPRGIPSTGDVGSTFLLETAVNWLGDRISHIPHPFIGYFHLLPPHGPYNTSREFFNKFQSDGFKPPFKPEDIFTEGLSYEALLRKRTEYDEFILYVDKEFGRFYDTLGASGLLRNTWLVLTSDHGEMFERGISAHSTDALYEPVIRIPLLIFEPGREVGTDIHVPTSAVDVLPTLAYVTGHPIPDWTEGSVLLPFASTSSTPKRQVYVVRAAKNEQKAPITQASISLVTGGYKLLYFVGYHLLRNKEAVKLFDLEKDPEELNDLAASQPDIATGLLQEIKARIKEVDQPYL